GLISPRDAFVFLWVVLFDLWRCVRMSDSRLDRLRWALEVARASIEEVDADKRSPLLAQYRALLAELAVIEGEQPPEQVEVNGLVVLQEELAKRRQSGSSGSRRAPF